MPAATSSTDRLQIVEARPPSRLIVCFDGTGNSFQGTTGDTNIVKLYGMFDRTNRHQMHYYQPGIGTYPAEGPVNVGFFRSMVRKFESVIDGCLATSFDSHVIAGYKFVMRYYQPGDKIYVFGFSRGAFTARFLSRMISHVGLLSMGNEELVPFAYKVYQDYEKNRGGLGNDEAEAFMNSFKKHFCRTEDSTVGSKNQSGIKVHFLGLFDCVSSVGNLDVPFFKKQPPLPAVRHTASYIRHAVAIDERRVKFKAALFSQEKQEAAESDENIKEVWFPGNHSDIGGGWTADGDDGKPRKNPADDHFQLSDIALKWMVNELDEVESRDEPENRVVWDLEEKESFLKRYDTHKDALIGSTLHDTMTFKGHNDAGGMVVVWNIMEYLPFLIKRWEFVRESASSKLYKWDYIGFPLNGGGRRDIPSSALFHYSVIERMQRFNGKKERYNPKNSMFVKVSKEELAASGRDEPDGYAEDGSPLLAKTLSELAAVQHLEKQQRKDGTYTDSHENEPSYRAHFKHDQRHSTGDEKRDRIYSLGWSKH